MTLLPLYYYHQYFKFSFKLRNLKFTPAIAFSELSFPIKPITITFSMTALFFYIFIIATVGSRHLFITAELTPPKIRLFNAERPFLPIITRL